MVTSLDPKAGQMPSTEAGGVEEVELVGSTASTSVVTLESLVEGPLSAGKFAFTTELGVLVATPPQDSTLVEVSGYLEYTKATDLIGVTLTTPTADPPQEYLVIKNMNMDEPRLHV